MHYLISYSCYEGYRWWYTWRGWMFYFHGEKQGPHSVQLYVFYSLPETSEHRRSLWLFYKHSHNALECLRASDSFTPTSAYKGAHLNRRCATGRFLISRTLPPHKVSFTNKKSRHWTVYQSTTPVDRLSSRNGWSMIYSAVICTRRLDDHVAYGPPNFPRTYKLIRRAHTFRWVTYMPAPFVRP